VRFLAGEAAQGEYNLASPCWRSCCEWTGSHWVLFLQWQLKCCSDSIYVNLCALCNANVSNVLVPYLNEYGAINDIYEVKQV